ncbi:MAG: hypothetical protein JSR45_12110 [Proteobacteria bacterium]|nr:hypothetical protein [Pseudomonadota bacterium]
MNRIKPVSTAFVGVATLLRRPDTLLAWTLFQLPPSALSAGILWFLAVNIATGTPLMQQIPFEYFMGGILVVGLFTALWRPMLRSVALRAGIEPGPGAAWKLKWGRAETTLLLFSFTKSGAVPWSENALAGLLLLIPFVAAAMLWSTAPIPAAALYAVAAFVTVIWMRVRSSLTFPLVVDPDSHVIRRGGTFNWMQVRRVGWELTARHFRPLIEMELITFTMWLLVSAGLAALAVWALGGGLFVREVIASAAAADWERAVERAFIQLHSLPIMAYVVFGLWVAVVSALHMILCSVPTATAYLAVRSEEPDLAKRFA